MYFVVELQINVGGGGANLVTQHATKNEALSKYHTVLAYAAVSELPCHSAVVLDEEGRTVARESFTRNVPDRMPLEESEEETPDVIE